MAIEHGQGAASILHRILFVSRDEPILDELKKLLSTLPHVFIEQVAPEGDILGIMESRLSDILFTMLHMPGRSGMDTARKIKHRYPEVKIAMLSPFDFPEYHQAAKQNGVDFFFAEDTINGREIERLIQSLTDTFEANPAHRSVEKP